MKILMVISRTVPYLKNGVSIHVNEVYARLRKKCDITLLALSSFDGQKTPVETKIVNGNPIIYLNHTYYDAADDKEETPDIHSFEWLWVNKSVYMHREFLKILLKTEKYDLIHLQSYYSSLLVEIIKPFKIPIVCTIHALSYNKKNFNFSIRQYLAMNSEKIIAVCKYQKNEMLKLYPFLTDEDIKVIYNGVEKRNVKEKNNIDNNLIAFSGRLDNKKGVDILLRAFASIHADYQNTRLLIIGDGPERDNLENLASELKIYKKVKFTGWVDSESVRNLIGKAKIYVIPSRQDLFPLAVLEAMAEKIFIVSSTTGGLTELIIDNITGKNFETDNYNDLRKVLKFALDNPILCNRMAENAYNFVDHFSWNNTVNQLLNLYTKMLYDKERS